MKSYQKLKESKLKTVLIFQLALFPLYSLFMVSMSIIIAFLGGLNFSLKSYRKFDYKLITIFSIPLLLNIISLVWDENVQINLNIFIKSLSFIVFYTIFIIFKPLTTIEEIKFFIRLYIISTAIFSVFVLIYFLFNLELNFRDTLDKIPLIKEHAIYVNLITGLAIIFITHNYFSKKVVNIFLLAPIITLFFMANSRGVFIALVVLLFIRMIYYFDNVYKVVSFFALLLMTCSLIIYITPLKKRYNEFPETLKHILPINDNYNSLNTRIAIYVCSYNLFIKEPMLGYGAGGVQEALNECYTIFKTRAFENNTFNSHNQYVNYLLSYGVIGFLVMLFYFIYFLKISSRNKDEYFYFLVFFFISFFSENILSRNTGIVLFSMFNSLLYLKTTFNDNN